MAKKYAELQTYEAKLERVMERLGVEKFDYDWTRRECWIEFWYRGQLYKFVHSVANAQAHGIDIQHGSDVFAQVVLSLEDLARMVERGIYDLVCMGGRNEISTGSAEHTIVLCSHAISGHTGKCKYRAGAIQEACKGCPSGYRRECGTI